jgi:hypothetical protein
MMMDSRINKMSGEIAAIGNRVDQIEQGNFTPGMVDTVRRIIQPIEEKIAKRIDKLESGELTRDMTEAVRSIALPMHQTTDGDQTAMQSIADAQAKKQIAELEERNKRKTNLLIFNLEEENSGTQEEKRSKDKEKVQEIISKLKGKHQPKDIRRLGAPPRGDVNAEQTPRRPRPIRLTFQTELERDETLRAFKAVTRNRGADPNQSVTVSMRKDMTPQEREEDRALFF